MTTATFLCSRDGGKKLIKNAITPSVVSSVCSLTGSPCPIRWLDSLCHPCRNFDRRWSNGQPDCFDASNYVGVSREEEKENEKKKGNRIGTSKSTFEIGKPKIIDNEKISACRGWEIVNFYRGMRHEYLYVPYRGIADILQREDSRQRSSTHIIGIHVKIEPINSSVCRVNYDR